MIGQNTLVLTIMESKGLEFQDVLLYDLFTTSDFSNEWRIVYEYMKEKGMSNLPSTALSSSFNMEKHAVLCSELKQLYVAITRTRQRLWICEAAGFSRPIYDYWKKLSLVEVKHLSDSFADKIQIPSSKHKWKQQGIKLFCENNFRMARMCFSKAVGMHSERLAEAYELRANAESTQASHLQRKKLLKDAAMLFSSVGKNELAVECFYEIEDYKTAVHTNMEDLSSTVKCDIYLKESMLEKAGNCYYLAKCYELAAKVYEQAGAFTKSLSACVDGKLFEIGFQLICRWGKRDDTEQEFLHKGALYYFGVKDFKHMMKFVRSFSSKGEMRRFLNKKRCLDELTSLEIEWGNFEEVVKVARLKPDPVLEADLHRRGVLYYLGVKDFKSMMKFVRSFSSKDEMRRFLTEKGCLDELILLETEWGNFEEAAQVARLKPNPVLEADLLRRGALYYLGVKDFRSMMNLVRSFLSKGEMRSFLTEKGCLDKLLLLEIEWGNFEEAAKVGIEDDYSIEAALQSLVRFFWISLGLWEKSLAAEGL